MTSKNINVPDMHNVSILMRRAIEAMILKLVFDVVEEKFSRDDAEKIIGKA